MKPRCVSVAIFVWIADDVADHWTVADKRTPKGDPIYTDLAIETVLTLRLVFHQPPRQTEGFVGSILAFVVCQGQLGSGCG